MLYTETISREMARVTGLEPATSGVTGRHSNQLSYTRAFPCRNSAKRFSIKPRMAGQAGNFTRICTFLYKGVIPRPYSHIRLDTQS